MGSVDITEQLRNNYRFDVWMRQSMWWWSMLFWGVCANIVNAFRRHTRILEDHGFTSKDVISQYDFRKYYTLDLLGYYSGKTGGLFPYLFFLFIFI